VPTPEDAGTRQTERWVIEPRRPGIAARARDIWVHRRLLTFFAKRSLEKQYRRTVLGASWLFIRPLFPLFVSTIVFGGVLGVGSEGLPYFIFLVVGQAIWDFFANAVTWGTRSLDLNRGFLARMYIPRFILPVALLTPGSLTFGIYILVIAGAAAYYRFVDNAWYVTLGRDTGWSALALLLTAVLALGISFWTAVPALKARDVRFTVQYVLGFWLFLTPVIYPMSAISERWRTVASLNPMATYCQMFKHGLIGSQKPEPAHFATALAVTLVVFVSGGMYFSRAEADAADKV
jgi:lipopolysaccharide transport system permease protein